jgi:nucleoid DNA-binding protein
MPPQTGEEIKIKARKCAEFVLGEALREAVI